MRLSLWQKIFIGLILGVISGILLKDKATWIEPLGTLFIRSIKMLIVPLVFSSLVVGTLSIKDPKKMGRVGLKTLIVYLLTTAIAITIGLLVGSIINPGAGVSITASESIKATNSPDLIQTFIEMVPVNPFKALVSDNILQIIVFSILFGFAINSIGKKGEPLAHFFDSLAETMYKLTAIVMEFAPYGVFALMAVVAGKYGLSILLPLFKMVGGVYLAVIIHMIITYASFLLFSARLNPVPFFKGILDAQIVAFSTTSSSATLPVTLTCTQKNLGVSKGISSFVLPLGATINMDGTAIYQGVCALFVAQVFNVDLTFANYVTIILTATLASIGTAGVPGAGLIMLSMVLSSVGLPVEGIAIVAGVDRILDMARTAVNVTGDAMVSVLIAKSENELNTDQYNKSPQL